MIEYSATQLLIVKYTQKRKQLLDVYLYHITSWRAKYCNQEESTKIINHIVIETRKIPVICYM